MAFSNCNLFIMLLLQAPDENEGIQPHNSSSKNPYTSYQSLRELIWKSLCFSANHLITLHASLTCSWTFRDPRDIWGGLLAVSRGRTKHGEAGFCYATQTWTDLPDVIRQAPTPTTFRSKLQIILFCTENSSMQLFFSFISTVDKSDVQLLDWSCLG